MLQTNVKGPLTLAAIVIGLSLLLGLGGSYFLSSALANQAQAVADARVASARAATLGPRIASLKAQEAAAAAYERVITLLMPTQEQLLEVPHSIEQLGSTHNVDAHFRFLGSPQAGATKLGASLPFSLMAGGSPDSLLEYLDDLEIKNPHFTISVSSVELIAGNDAQSNSMNINGNVYYQ